MEDKGDKLDLAALTLFFKEKYFASVRLAIVSFNNLLLHFEEEYREYYNDIIEKAFMPLFNEFKTKMHVIFMEFENSLTLKVLEGFELSVDDLKIRTLPLFRKKFDE